MRRSIASLASLPCVHLQPDLIWEPSNQAAPSCSLAALSCGSISSPHHEQQYSANVPDVTTATKPVLYAADCPEYC